MDPLGAALAVLALGLYPGGLFLLTVGRLGAAVAGFERGRPPGVPGLLAVAAACCATALAPLPASPAAVLPPQGGASPDLAITAALAAVAVAAPFGVPWTHRRLAVPLGAAAAVLALAVAAGSLSLETIRALPGPGMAAARWLAAAALLTAAPLAAGAFVAGPRVVRSTVMAMLVVLGASLLVPPGLSGGPAVLGASLIALTVIVHAAVVRRIRPLLVEAWPPLAAFGVALGVAAVTVAAIAAR